MPVIAEGRPTQKSSGAGARLNVTVVFTGSERTDAALRTAGELARQLNGQVTLVAPIAVSWHLPLHQPPVPLEWNRERFIVLANECPVETAIWFYLCRDSWETLRRVLRPGSLVVLGGRKRWWTKEARLARRLRRLGHEVVLAEKG